MQGVAVSQALPLGFSAIDSAHHYMNQAGVAAGIAKTGVALIYLTTFTFIPPPPPSSILPIATNTLCTTIFMGPQP